MRGGVPSANLRISPLSPASRWLHSLAATFPSCPAVTGHLLPLCSANPTPTRRKGLGLRTGTPLRGYPSHSLLSSLRKHASVGSPIACGPLFTKPRAATPSEAPIPFRLASQRAGFPPRGAAIVERNSIRDSVAALRHLFAPAGPLKQRMAFGHFVPSVPFRCPELMRASSQRSSHQKSTAAVLRCHSCLRRDRDSNSGYPFGVYTLSRRAS